MHRNPANGYRLFKRSDLDKFLNKASKARETEIMTNLYKTLLQLTNPQSMYYRTESLHVR